MLIDHRTYTVRPGTLPLQMKLYEEYGLKAQKHHLGEPLAWLVTEFGRDQHVRPYLGLQGRRRPHDAACGNAGGPGLAGVHEEER